MQPSTNPEPIISQTVGKLRVLVFDDEHQMGAAAGHAVAERMRKVLEAQDNLRMVFASAPSQLEMWRSLAAAEGIDWGRVTAFHMDEYVGFPPGSPGSLGGFLMRHLLEMVHPGEVHLIDGSAQLELECGRYSALIAEAPIDITCLGIGENGHIAFNEPKTADFHDPYLMKVVRLDPASRQQQVNDGLFPSLETTPEYALTLTVPAIMAASTLYCVVPGKRKREAVKMALNGEITHLCPASVLRRHPNCTLYLDRASWGG